MTALYIILGIIAFFILLLSIPICVESEYIDTFILNIKWLFIKIPIFPIKPKKDKAKKESKPKPQKEEPAREQSEKPQKPNPFKTFYENQGFDGVVTLIQNTADALGTFGKSLKKHIILKELYLWATISHNQDAAKTAIQYGEACQNIFPAMGYICSNLKVKKYDVEVEPDFIGTFSSAQFAFSLSVRPIFLINAAIAMAFRMLFNVVLKVIKEKPKKTNENITEPINNESGANL